MTPSATDPLRCFVAIALNKSRVVQSKTHVSVCHSPLLDHQTWELRRLSHWCATSDTSLVVRCQIGVDVEVRGPPWSACLWSHTKLFCDSKLHLSRQKRRGVYAENVSTRKEFLVEDDWLLLMSPKGQTAHQNLLTNPSAFFFPREEINAHAISSDTPFTGWGTATCLRSAALSRTRLVAKSLSLWNHQGPCRPWCAHSRKPWWGRVWLVHHLSPVLLYWTPCVLQEMHASFFAEIEKFTARTKINA